jgi:tRNA threonylcarbamoyladenosine biosynthesis protein TsaB
MCFILGIETSSDVLSLAVSKDRKILRSLDLRLEQSHARQIWSLTQSILELAGVAPEEIGLIAVGKGPGSYTGIRIGTAFAKGWAFAQQTPMVSIGTLENMYHQVAEVSSRATTYIALDARRNEVFRACWKEDGTYLKPPAAALLEEESFLEDLKDQPVRFLGSGAEKTFDFFGKPQNWQILPSISANAETCCQLGWDKFLEGQIEKAETFEPDYLKPVYITRKSNG